MIAERFKVVWWDIETGKWFEDIRGHDRRVTAVAFSPNGRQLASALGQLGYQITRQTGSHIRLTTQQGGEHHLTIPDHDPLKVGTLAAILRDVAAYVGMTRAETVRTLFS